MFFCVARHKKTGETFDVSPVELPFLKFQNQSTMVLPGRAVVVDILLLLNSV